LLQFETEWGISHAQSIENMLKRVPVQFQTALLEELFYVDIEFCTKNFEIFSDDDYFERFPKHHNLIRKILNNVKSVNGERKIVIENINAKIEMFKIMNERYCNRRKRHLLRMNLIWAILIAK
jgi:hypothetical protein